MGTSGARTRKERSPRSHGGKTTKHNGFCYSLSPNSLWSVWYCIIVVAVQIYIVAVSIKCFGRYISLPWPIDDQPYLELNAYVGFLGASVVIMPFFVAAAILRIGNYPNDGQKICTQTEYVKPEDFAVYENVKTKRKDKRARVLWRHGAPLAPFLHIASAFCLLLPKVLIQAQLIKHGFLKKSQLWNSELDFLIAHRDRLVSLSFLPTVNDSASAIWDQEAKRMDTTSTQSPQVQLDTNTVAVSAEFLNFGASLLIYAIRYPSVFWDANKPFGFLFSFQLLLNGLQQLLAFTGFSILYKVQIFNPAGALMRYTPPMMNATTTMLLFFLYNIAMTATSCTLHGYGLQKHREWLERRLRKHHHISWGSGTWRLWGYTPHVSAFVVLVTLACSGVPFIYDFTIVYWGSLDGAVLAAVSGTVAHLFMWIVLWLFLTVKQRWTFHGNTRRAPLDAKFPECAKFSSFNGHSAQVSRMKDMSGDPPPLLVIDHEKTYQVREKSCQKAILSLASQSYSQQKTSSSTDEEDIYWLKPRLPSPKAVAESTSDTARSRIWAGSQTMCSVSSKSPNVVSDETNLNTFPTKRKSPHKSSKSSGSKSEKRTELEDFSETVSEDGDYAILANHQNYDISRPRREVRDIPTWKGVPV